MKKINADHIDFRDYIPGAEPGIPRAYSSLTLRIHQRAISRDTKSVGRRIRDIFDEHETMLQACRDDTKTCFTNRHYNRRVLSPGHRRPCSRECRKTCQGDHDFAPALWRYCRPPHRPHARYQSRKRGCCGLAYIQAAREVIW
jgi:hypothetical protein